MALTDVSEKRVLERLVRNERRRPEESVEVGFDGDSGGPESDGAGATVGTRSGTGAD